MNGRRSEGGREAGAVVADEVVGRQGSEGKANTMLRVESHP